MPNSGAIPFVAGKTLAHFTSPGLIIPRLRGREVASVIQELSRVLQREARVTDLLPFYHAALNKEFLVGTTMDAEMAFPHARLPDLKELAFAFGRSDEPLEWSGRSGKPVRLVFLFAVPSTDATQYLLLVSGLARFGRNQEAVAKLHHARDAFEIYELFRDIVLRPTPNTAAPGH